MTCFTIFSKKELQEINGGESLAYKIGYACGAILGALTSPITCVLNTQLVNVLQTLNVKLMTNNS